MCDWNIRKEGKGERMDGGNIGVWGEDEMLV